MTAIVMIFEMTRNYSVIVPMIIAVALAAGVRRALIRETIYTIKLRHRGHRIPQDRHANLYLVQQAASALEAEFIVAETGVSLLNLLSTFQTDATLILPVVVVQGNRICGVVPPRAGLWPTAFNNPSSTIDAVATRDYVLAHEGDALERVFERMKRHKKSLALVVRGQGVPRVDDIKGVITKTIIADAVIDAAD